MAGPAPSIWPRRSGWRTPSTGPGSAIVDARWRPDGSGARGPRARATSRAPSTSIGATDLIDPAGADAAPAGRTRGRITALATRLGHRRRDRRRGLRRQPEPVRRPRLVEPAGLRAAVGAGARRRLPGLGRGGPRDLERCLDAAAGDLHAGRPGAHARDDDGCPRPARVAQRDPARRAGAGRVPGVRGQHEAPGAHPGRGQRPGRGDQPARQPAAARCGRRCATCSTRPT